MANKTLLNLNVAALTALNGNTKVRVRVKDGVLQMRPTDRVLASNLPEGETLRTVSYKRSGDKVEGAKFGLPGATLEKGARYEVVAGKYGWLSLVPAASVARGTPAASVSVKA